MMAIACPKFLFLLTAALYAGDDVCTPCHKNESLHHRQSAMANALQSVASCDILRQHPKLNFREGPYATEIARAGDRNILTVTNGNEKLTVPLVWAFGLGEAGQTYVFQRNGAWYESRASFFNALQALDLTMGAHGSKPSSLEEAAGRRMDANDARACFGCHSTGAARSPGVGCEACHGSAVAHVAAIHSGNAPAAKMTKLGSLNTEEMSELCGGCHRTWSQIALDGPRGVNNVRFQPYRLTNSKCYDAVDRRIRCTACHDPHESPVREAAFYDAKCAACHTSAAHAKTCPVSKKDCVTCHMPKIELPGAHTKFTDHEIRIARANEPYPN
jgi:hypothetical protein